MNVLVRLPCPDCPQPAHEPLGTLHDVSMIPDPMVHPSLKGRPLIVTSACVRCGRHNLGHPCQTHLDCDPVPYDDRYEARVVSHWSLGEMLELAIEHRKREIIDDLNRQMWGPG